MLRVMSRGVLQTVVAARTSMITRHITSAASQGSAEQPVLFEKVGEVKKYILNREKKLNAVDDTMVNLIKEKASEWDNDPECKVIVGTGKGRAFCAGGDINSVMTWSKTEETRPRAIKFFKDEFEMNHLLGNLAKPYVAIMHGITMGGGVGLSVHAPFRVATENTVFAMPETKIGYFPDVGSNHFLARLDGQLGPYFALTGTTLKGRAIYDLGIATHYIASKYLPEVEAELSALRSEDPDQVDVVLEKFYEDGTETEPQTPLRFGVRKALDEAFSEPTVEEIISSLTEMTKNEGEVGEWAKATLHELHMRSPTSLKVALQAIRRGKKMTLAEVLQMEMNVATAFINGASPDFVTGVTAVLVDKIKDRPKWSPDNLSNISDEHITKAFFDPLSPFLANSPQLEISKTQEKPFRNYALPTEEEIGEIVQGSHPTSGLLSMDAEEIQNHMAAIKLGKGGMVSKLKDVLERRCKVVPATAEITEHVEWIH